MLTPKFVHMLWNGTQQHSVLASRCIVSGTPKAGDQYVPATSHFQHVPVTPHLQYIPIIFSHQFLPATGHQFMPTICPTPIIIPYIPTISSMPRLIFNELPDDGILNDVLGSMEQPNLRSMIYNLEKEMIKQQLADLENSAPLPVKRVIVLQNLQPFS